MQVSSSVQSANTTVAKPRQDSANPFRINDFIRPDDFGATYYDTQKPDTKPYKLDINDPEKLQQKRKEQQKADQVRELRSNLERLNARKAELENLQGKQFMGELGTLTGQIGSLQSEMSLVGSGNIGGLVGFSQTM